MSPKEYSKKKYPLAINYQIIAEECYIDGLNANPNMAEMNKLKKELVECKKELKDLNELLHDDNRLIAWLAGG